MPKSLWVRLAGCVGAILAGYLAVKFMGVQQDVVTAHILIIVLVAALVGYVIVHTLLEHFTVSKVAPTGTPAHLKVGSTPESNQH